MKILYEDLINLLELKPSKIELSEKLFQLGHEHEIDGDIFEMELTPNRGDCFSLIGLARDLNHYFSYKDNIEIFNGDLEELNLKFKNLAPNECPDIYFLEIEIDQIPSEYKPYLNNYFIKLKNKKTNFYTDISNYLSYELGQPTHCYERASIDDELTLESRECSETFDTLLNKKIELEGKNLVFSLNNKIINLAGVMGGLKTACTKKTKKALIESAFFQPESIIGKSVKYNLPSEASHKFERGIDPLLQEKALRRFIKIVSDHTKIIDIKIKRFNNNQDILLNKIDINNLRINNILGTDLNKDTFCKYLTSLGLKADGEDRMIIPSYRHDIKTQNDIAEEIARLIGYNNIPSSSIKIDKFNSESIDKKAKLRNFLIEKGFNEVINFPFTELASKNSLVVDNPLDTNKKYIRIDLKESLISNLLFNERRQKDSIKLYEISDVYSKDLDLKRDAKIGIIASGRQGENYKEFVQKISNNFLNEEFSILNISFEEIPRNTLNTKVKSKIFYTEVLLENIPNDFFINYKFKKKPINFIRYKKVSEYPGSVRDISFSITDIEITDEIFNYFDQVSHANLKKVFMFDFYQNYKNNEIKLGYRFIFQSELNTLKDEEINNSIQEIIDPILKKKGVFIPGM